MDMPQAPAGQPAAGPSPQAGAYCIELYVNPDGTFEVSKVDKDPAEPKAPGGQPADNIGDALKLVLDLYEQDGNATADDEFEQGFGAQEAPAKPPMAAQLGSYKGGAQ